ncbi:MAG: hypothetical protein GY836_18180, partial [Herbaspirillum sp.]|uniref:hypothetical protein n=1 Tax=Herbaspirillum sp. TaxID=1890675 RepID=UPI00258D96B1
IGPANLKVPQPKEKKQTASPKEGRTSAKKSKAEAKTSAVSIPKQQRPVASGKAPKYVASKLPPSKTIYVESSDSEADVLAEEKLQKKKKVSPKGLTPKKVMDPKESMLKTPDPKGSELIPEVSPSGTETGTQSVVRPGTTQNLKSRETTIVVPPKIKSFKETQAQGKRPSKSSE